MSVRTERVASVLKEELGTYVQRKFPMDEHGFMTVTEVRVSPDLREAKVYVSVFGDAQRKKKSLEMLEGHKPAIRSSLGRALRLRYTPELTFFLDDTLDKALSMEQLFRRIHDEERERKPDEADRE